MEKICRAPNMGVGGTRALAHSIRLSCYPDNGSWITGRATASSTSCCLTCMPKTSNSGKLTDLFMFFLHPSDSTDVYSRSWQPSSWHHRTGKYGFFSGCLHRTPTSVCNLLAKPFFSGAGMSRAAKRRSFWQVEGQNSLFGVCLRALSCSGPPEVWNVWKRQQAVRKSVGKSLNPSAAFPGRTRMYTFRARFDSVLLY